jgi:S1-C subfamily serine protease
MMSSGTRTPVIRSLTFLVLTTSAATVATAQQSSQGRCRDCTPSAERKGSVEARAVQVRDSLRARGGLLVEDIERVAIQLLNAKRVQLEAQQALTALQSGQIAEANRGQAETAARRFRLQFDQAARQAQTLRTQLSALCDRGSKPQGYMGITFSANMRAEAEGTGAEVFRFDENPTVETVEPGSPAEHAGVSKGDEIILIGGQQVVGRDIVWARLLRPGNKLPIRVRRDGDTRDVLLVVGERPQSLDNGCPFLDARIMAAFGDQFTPPTAMAGGLVRMAPNGQTTIIRRPLPPEPTAAPTPRAPSGTVTVTMAPPAAMVPRVPLPAATPEPRRSESNAVYVVTGASTAPMMIAGATIIRPNADLRETFGVKNGVLVLDVARGSPAYGSGLKGGDVIVSVGRVPVTSPLSIQRAIENADGSELTLRIVRKKREQSLVLRW